MKELKKLIKYLTENNKYIRIDDQEGWGHEAEVSGFIPFPQMNGIGLRAIKTGASYSYKNALVRRGNHLELQLRTRNSTTEVHVDERITLGEIFPDCDIVVVSKGNVVQFFAPVIKSRSEMFSYIAMLQSHLAERRAKGKVTFWNFEGDMMDLAIYLYQNHPDKEEDESIYDRI